MACTVTVFGAATAIGRLDIGRRTVRLPSLSTSAPNAHVSTGAVVTARSTLMGRDCPGRRTNSSASAVAVIPAGLSTLTDQRRAVGSTLVNVRVAEPVPASSLRAIDGRLSSDAAMVGRSPATISGSTPSR